MVRHSISNILFISLLKRTLIIHIVVKNCNLSHYSKDRYKTTECNHVPTVQAGTKGPENKDAHFVIVEDEMGHFNQDWRQMFLVKRCWHYTFAYAGLTGHYAKYSTKC